MNIDEAIERENALAYSYGERYKRLGEPVGDLQELEAEHRQMAEWLRELKAYREGCKCEDCKYQKSEYCNSCYAEDSDFWVYKGEVNADD